MQYTYRGKKMTTLKEPNEIGKTAIVKAFLKECGTTISNLKEKIAKESIDFTGFFEENHTLLLRIIRGRNEIKTEYYRDGEDGYNSRDRFWYEFSIYYYHALPSGRNIRETDEGYKILDGEEVIGEISLKDLKDELINDLTIWKEGKFNEEFEEFLEELYAWIVEVNM